MTNAVCVSDVDTFSSPWCLDFTTYGLLCTDGVPDFNGGSGGTPFIWVAADPADFPSAYSGRVIAFEPYLLLGTYLITIIYCSKPRISSVEI